MKSLRHQGVLLGLVGLLLTGCGPTSSTEDVTFNLLQNWDKVGMKNHYNAGSNIGPLNWFTVEGLIQYVRSTDEIYYVLAESVTHNADHTSIIKLRKEAKWQNGDDYKAEDVVAYYYLNQVEVTNYMTSIESVDDKTVKINWKAQMEPNDRVKTLLLSVDKAGTIKYSEFKEYVDEAKGILNKSAMAPADYTGWAPFNHLASQADSTAYLANYMKFKKYNPSWFVATGPYKIKVQSETEMILEKNPYYWALDNLKFDFIKATNSMSDLNQIYSMLKTGRIDYQDGLAPEATLDRIISSNPDMTHYKMFDPGAIGLVFNLNKEKPYGKDGASELFWTDNVREAFQYIFDREIVKDSGNPYGVTSYFPLMTMAPSEAKSNMSDVNYKKLPTYSHNEAKAEELLKADGWEKVSGSWTKNGKKVSLKLDYDGSHPGQSGAAIATQAALKGFGIDCELKRQADFNSWFGSAQSENFANDFSLCWTDLNMSFSFPTGSFIYGYNDITAKVLQLPKFTKETVGLPNETYIGKLQLQLDKADGTGKFYVADHISGMYCLSDAELKTRVDDLVLGMAHKNYGVQFYQNVTGSFLNKGKIGGLPMQEKWTENRNISYVPTRETDEANFLNVARLNLHYAAATEFITGHIYPVSKK